MKAVSHIFQHRYNFEQLLNILFWGWNHLIYGRSLWDLEGAQTCLKIRGFYHICCTGNNNTPIPHPRPDLVAKDTFLTDNLASQLEKTSHHCQFLRPDLATRPGHWWDAKSLPDVLGLEPGGRRWWPQTSGELQAGGGRNRTFKMSSVSLKKKRGRKRGGGEWK